MQLFYLLLISSCNCFIKKPLTQITRKYMFKYDHEFNKTVSYDVVQSLYDYWSINTSVLNSALELTEEPRRVYTNDNFYKDIKEIIKSKYGAYSEHDPSNVKTPKKNKKNKKKDNKEYFKKQMNNINNNKNINKNDKPVVFLISPNQLHHYKSYNKTMEQAKIERNKLSNTTNIRPHNNNNENKTLPEDYDNEEFYTWF